LDIPITFLTAAKSGKFPDLNIPISALCLLAGVKTKLLRISKLWKFEYTVPRSPFSPQSKPQLAEFESAISPHAGYMSSGREIVLLQELQGLGAAGASF
jgi:hypothetical protein